MLKGDFMVTNNINALPIYGANYKIVILSEDKNVVQQYNGLPGTILLPPYGAVCAEMDNNLEAFYGIYFAHLNDYAANGFISAILRALYEGINICLYIPSESNGLRFNIALVEYFANTYGICLGADSPVMYVYHQDPVMYLNILNTLYIHNHLSIDGLFAEYPPGLPILETMLPKLIQEFNAPDMLTLDKYANYFFEYKERIKANNNIFLKPGIVFGDK